MKKLFSILFISLFIFSCDDDDNPVIQPNEIEIDWILYKVSDYEFYNDFSLWGPYIKYFFIGDIENIINVLPTGDYLDSEFDGILNFEYLGENFTFDFPERGGRNRIL